MVPELGSFALVLALCFALIQGASQLCLSASVFRLELGKAAIAGQFVFLSMAMLCLITSFVMNDMSVIFVREHSHQLLPLIYRMGAAWGGHEGSFLLWCLVLSSWTLAFILFADRDLAASFIAKIIMLLGWMNAGFIGFLFFTSNPFLRDYPEAPLAGNDLTPILQDPGLIFHPPMLYLGYVGFAVVFAFVVAALLEGKLNREWARACRPWVMLPWSFLSCGIVLGSWWAYRELGWGGWWFWDPVENASLLPWLAATGLMHSLIVSEQRGVFKGWTILLAIMTFALCLLGTFLVRSGVIVSVHAFASDPTRGVYLLIYLALLIGGALLCYGYRIKAFYQPPQFQFFSRETLLLINSIVLMAAVATIVVGTLYPILLDALQREKISVGEPYFNTVFLPMMLPLVILMGFAPHVNWRQQSVAVIWQRLRLSIVLSLVAGFTLPWLFGFEFHVLTSVGVAAGIWIIVGTMQYMFELWHTKRLGLRHGAMILAHLGIAMIVLGVTLNKSYSMERQVKMRIGESVALAGYDFTFVKLNNENGSNYEAVSAEFAVRKPSGTIETLTAEQRIYTSHEQQMSKAGILMNLWRDLYVALGSPLSDGSWSIRFYYKPFVRWIWFGGFMLLAGGLCSVLTHLRRRGARYE